MKQKSTQLIRYYFYICDAKNSDLFAESERFSPNNRPKFTDEELISCYLFALAQGFSDSVKGAYEFIRDYWGDWFPNLPSYQAFNYRLNRLADYWQALIGRLLSPVASGLLAQAVFILDSCPIFLCQGYRKSRASWPVKGYCASKKKYYYGVKFHVLARKQSGLPMPLWVGFTDANVHDLTAVKQDLIDYQGLTGATILADKAYMDRDLHQQLEKKGCTLITPDKHFRGTPKNIKQSDEAAHRLFNSWIASNRQTIESLFSWLAQHRNFQNASKVRSQKGLVIHLFAKLASAICRWMGVDNP